MRLTTRCILVTAMAGLISVPTASAVQAAWPWTAWEGSPRIDPIPPLGSRLPESYRRQYNRPSYLGGKIAAKIEPSSQEAMAFHRAESLGLYDDNGIQGFFNGKRCPPQRVEQHYFYPKPWEALQVGPRSDVDAAAAPVATPSNEPESISLGAPTTQAEPQLGDLLQHGDAEMMELPMPQADPQN